MSKIKRMENGKYRLQFDFSEDAFNRFDSLTKETEASTRVEMLRNALRVYEWLVHKAKDGNDLNISADDLSIITNIRH